MAFGFSDVIELSGATRSQLIHWTDKQLITASIQEATGRGGWRQFDKLDVLLVMAAVELTRRFSFPLRPLKAALAAVKEAASNGEEVVFLSGTSAQRPRRSDVRDTAAVEPNASSASGRNWMWIGSYSGLAYQLQAPPEKREPAFRENSTGVVVDVARLWWELKSKLERG